MGTGLRVEKQTSPPEVRFGMEAHLRWRFASTGTGQPQMDAAGLHADPGMAHLG